MNKNKLEVFLAQNWRSVIFVGVLVFGWFVWPTFYSKPFNYWDNDGGHLYRQNRLTHGIESYWSWDGKWMPCVAKVERMRREECLKQDQSNK